MKFSHRLAKAYLNSALAELDVTKMTTNGKIVCEMCECEKHPGLFQTSATRCTDCVLEKGECSDCGLRCDDPDASESDKRAIRKYDYCASCIG